MPQDLYFFFILAIAVIFWIGFKGCDSKVAHLRSPEIPTNSNASLNEVAPTSTSISFNQQTRESR